MLTQEYSIACRDKGLPFLDLVYRGVDERQRMGRWPKQKKHAKQALASEAEVAGKLREREANCFPEMNDRKIRFRFSLIQNGPDYP